MGGPLHREKEGDISGIGFEVKSCCTYIAGKTHAEREFQFLEILGINELEYVFVRLMSNLIRNGF